MPLKWESSPLKGGSVPLKGESFLIKSGRVCKAGEWIKTM